MASEPALVVLYEPTTGLDVVTQGRVLSEIRRLAEQRAVTMVYISHDLAVLSEIAGRIAIMYAGRIVEEGPTSAILRNPRHPYTRGLVAAIPDHSRPMELEGIPGAAVGLNDRPAGCAFAPRCSQRVARCDEQLPPLRAIDATRFLRCCEAVRTPALAHGRGLLVRTASTQAALLDVQRITVVHEGHGDTVVAARDVSFTVGSSECLALVGESGSGETTIARAIAGLHAPASGTILLGGTALPPRSHQRSRQLRRRCQIIFQNPFESLNPRQLVGEQVARPARLLRNSSHAEAKDEVSSLLERVRLPKRLAGSYPSELSGGERQRVAIARALAQAPSC